VEKRSRYNLLTATSGLEDFDKQGLDVYERPFSTEELLTRFCSKSEMEPGKKFNYNNADYVVLGKIIEEIYKKPYEQVLSEQILQPLKMKNTGMCADAAIIKNLANTYYWDDSTKSATNSEHNYIENYYASGAMYSTASDLLLFSNALYGDKILKDETLKLLLRPSLSTYACGLWVYDLDINRQKVKIAERQGNIRGATTRLLRVLDKDVTIIFLTNLYRANLDEFQVEIIKLLVR
jgi:D-alanyl-D-alanine carboxypeptidase